MVVETRGGQFSSTRNNRVLQKSCFQDLQHLEQEDDQGNRIYSRLYDLWVKIFQTDHPDQQIPTWASKRDSSLAGHIVETYKMVAEQVIAFNSNQERDRPILDCIDAARFILQSAVPREPQH